MIKMTLLLILKTRVLIGIRRTIKNNQIRNQIKTTMKIMKMIGKSKMEILKIMKIKVKLLLLFLLNRKFLPFRKLNQAMKHQGPKKMQIKIK